tara:strand:- start:3079 stop:3483 length:405 start_codon:yes stop_codon:yes gene_type:complete
MSLQLVLLKNGDQLVSDVKSIKSEEDKKVYSYLMKNPMCIREEESDPKILLEGEDDIQTGYDPEYEEELTLSMTRWPRFSQDNEVYVSPEWIVALVEPIPQIVEMYNSYEKKNESKSNPVSIVEESGSSIDLQG